MQSNRLTNIFSLALFATCLLAGCNNKATPEKQSKAFENTLEIHLNAIKNRNITALEPTVGEQVAMISPTGNKMDSKEVFIKFHEKWFTEKNWEWEGDIIRTESTDSLGYALIRYKYSVKDSIGNLQFQDNEYLVLIFKNSAKGWQLVHDQNTQIK